MTSDTSSRSHLGPRPSPVGAHAEGGRGGGIHERHVLNRHEAAIRNGRERARCLGWSGVIARGALLRGDERVERRAELPEARCRARVAKDLDGSVASLEPEGALLRTGLRRLALRGLAKIGAS